MFTAQDIQDILFLDIETASQVPTFADLSPRMQALWTRKAVRYQKQEPEKSAETLYPEKAAIHAEFGQVVCISCGYLRFGPDHLPHLKVKSFFGPDERRTLEAFGEVLNQFIQGGKGKRRICAHNGKEFDFPYLGRRYVIQGLAIPPVLQVQGQKPWETSFIDTMELWKFGDFKAYTSLDLLSAVLGIPSPKDDIDGSQVGRVFWEEQGYDRIRTYCEKDVQTTAQVLLKMSRLPLIPVPDEA